MSRFVKPEMEVIRFTEEDVIVASGKKSDVQMKGAVLSNFLNGKENDATLYLELSDGDSTTHDWQGLKVDKAAGYLHDSTFHVGSDSTSLEKLINAEYNDGTKEADNWYSRFNGDYSTNNGGLDWYIIKQ